MKIMNEFDKCKFYKYYDEYEGCECACYNKEDFKPDHERIIKKAKNMHISITDIIALINL